MISRPGSLQFIPFIFLWLIPCSTVGQQHLVNEAGKTIVSRIALPPGYLRTDVVLGGFAAWLRDLPLKPEGSPVLLYSGELKANQQAHIAVIDMDVGDRDLQQCADAVIRLRTEYLYSIGDYARIHFNFTSGDEAAFQWWIAGDRPIINGNRVTWKRDADVDSSYAALRSYLDCVMTYAGTYSLAQELVRVADVREMRIGDVFIQGGFPGHAVIVVDLCEHPATGERLFLLAQSYMPAQDIHILRNPTGHRSPWYDRNFGEVLVTPEWTFTKDDLYRFSAE